MAKQTKNRRFMISLVASLAAMTVLFVGAVKLHTEAQGVGFGLVRVEQPLPALASIPTCEEAGVCRDERRLLLPAASPRMIERLQGAGCRVTHALREETAFACPRGLAVSGARIERAFRAQDFFSDEQIGATLVWGQGLQGTGVRIALLDTGAESAHPELLGRIIAFQDFTPGNGTDVLGHGTHVAGIIAGQGVRDFEGNRVLGVSPGAELVVGKVCGDDGWCLESDIMAGLEWALGRGARVINLSLGGGTFGDHCDDDPLARAVNWTVDQGATVVAAAGNSGQGVGTPACASKAIAVGAVDRSDVRAPWSSIGPALDLMAPGVDILSSYSCAAAGSCPVPSYAWLSGTSMATPHVVGVAALLLERMPSLTPREIANILTETAVDRGPPGFDIFHGFGRIDASAALARLEETSLDADGDGFSAETDCDDGNPFVFPGAPEVCNGVDDDCDGRSDDECQFEGFCGDLVCQSTETDRMCPQDCGTPSPGAPERPGQRPMCGNGICELTENAPSCPQDCTNQVPSQAIDASGGKAGGAASEPHTGGASGAAPAQPGGGGQGGGSGGGGGGGGGQGKGKGGA